MRESVREGTSENVREGREREREFKRGKRDTDEERNKNRDWREWKLKSVQIKRKIDRERVT